MPRPHLGHDGERVPLEHRLNRVPVMRLDAHQHEECGCGLPPLPQEELRDDLVRTRVVEDRNRREVHLREGRSVQLVELALDRNPHGPPGRTGHEVRVQACYAPLEELLHVHGQGIELEPVEAPPLSHGSVLAGRMIVIWAPGNGARPSSSGAISSQSGTSAMRAVPLRIEIAPCHRRTCLRICWIPWPRP